MLVDISRIFSSNPILPALTRHSVALRSVHRTNRIGVHYERYNELLKKNYCSQPSHLLSFAGKWPDNDRKSFTGDMRVLEHFINEQEELTLLDEIEPYLKRLRYEYDHWDDAIHGYRETERKHWFPANRNILDRVVAVAFQSAAMPYIHVLDLADEGVIKPHVDSVRYCGNTIAGISLLSDSVMRLVRTNDEEQTNEEYRQIFSKDRDKKFWADVLLPRRSLYVMKHSARYNFTHEILAGEESRFNESYVNKTRRISIICRNDP